MEGIGGFGSGSIEAGDVICGLKGPDETIDPDDDGGWYAAHLLLKGNEAGAAKVDSASSYTGRRLRRATEWRRSGCPGTHRCPALPVRQLELVGHIRTPQQPP